MMRIQRIIILCLLSVLPAAVAAAQESVDTRALAQMSLEELMQVPVTAASKKPSTAEKSPAHVTVITQEEIRRFGYRNINDALRRVAGMYVSSDRNYDGLGVRGVSRPGDYNTRVLLLVNGHRLNDAIYDEATIGEGLPVDIENIKQIEVIKGPVSAAWGTNALLGVINIVLNEGQDIKGAYVTGTIENQGYLKSFAEFGDKLPGGLEYSGSFTYLTSEGRPRLYYPEFESPDTNDGIYEDNDQQYVRRANLNGSYEGLRWSFLHGWRNKHIPTASYETTFNDPRARTVDDSTRADISWESELLPEKEGKLLIRSYYDKVRYHGWYPYGTGAEATFSTDATTSNQAGLEARYSQNFNDRFSWLIGTEYQYAWDLRMHAEQIEPEYLSNLSTDDCFNLNSFYLETDYSLTSDFRLVLNARYDYYSTFGGEISPRAAVVYNPFESSSLKLSYGEAFRAPNNYERRYGDGLSQIGNDSLDPEKTRGWELTWEQRVRRDSSLALTLYHQTIDEVISQTISDEELLQFQNAESILTYGAEMQAQSRLAGDIISYAALSVGRASDRSTHLRISNSPLLTGTLGISVPVFAGFYASPEVYYISNRQTLSPDTDTQPTLLANLVLYNKSVWRGISLQTGIYNIFDDTPYSSGAGEHAQARIPGDGRIFRLQIGSTF